MKDQGKDPKEGEEERRRREEKKELEKHEQGMKICPILIGDTGG